METQIKVSDLPPIQLNKSVSDYWVVLKLNKLKIKRFKNNGSISNPRIEDGKLKYESSRNGKISHKSYTLSADMMCSINDELKLNLL